MRREAEVTRGADIDYYGQRAYLLAEVTREGGHFSVTGSIYSSRRAFELGSDSAVIACGQVVEEVRAALPELRAIQDLHLSDTTTGEPTHSASNAWYWYSSYDGRGTHLTDGARTDYDVACSHLRVDSIAGPHDRASLERWIDADLRPRWQEEADAANAWIDANLGGPTPGNVETDEADYYLDLGEADDADSLRVHARQIDESCDSIGGHYVYGVSVCDGDYTYETTYTGSAADYDDGRVCAREAAFGVLRELADFARHDSVEDVAEEFGMEYVPEGWRELHSTAVEFANHLEAHGDLVGLA